MRHVAIALLAVGSLAALPPRATAQRAAKELAAFTLASGARRQYRSVAVGLLAMRSQPVAERRGAAGGARVVEHAGRRSAARAPLLDGVAYGPRECFYG